MTRRNRHTRRRATRESKATSHQPGSPVQEAEDIEIKERSRMSLDELWIDLRQGSRNVAGVSWQIAVSVDLLVSSYAGQLPFNVITPEGMEDIDCQHADGTKTFIQVKEVAAGAGRLAAAEIAEILKHAEDSARGSNIAVVTDGTLGSGLVFTGWDNFIATQGGRPVRDLVTSLSMRGMSIENARNVVERSHIISLPWRIRDLTEHRLARCADVHPSVASFTVSRLNQALSEAASDQRTRSFTNPARLAVADVDAVITDVQSVVDMSGLDLAVREGVCIPANFLDASALTAEEFYLGVDGHPGHIAANLDIPRYRELTECAQGAALERYVLLIGPSGAGKSVLLWRAARDAVPGAHVIRTLRVDGTADVDLLVRYVRLLRSSPSSPVVVVADNLGRPGMSAWPQAVAALREQPSVVLIGACRAEDFHPSLVNGAVRIIEPLLDQATGAAIAEKIATVGLAMKMDVAEAYERSEGLLMEFLAMLITGRRLRQVLALQAAELRAPGRELQRDAARLLTAAHSVGLSLDADRLGQALVNEHTSIDKGPIRLDDVGDALSVLKNEHIVTSNGQSWRGLHELRSITLSQLLHESPPPTLTTTWSRTAELLDPDQAGWLLRRIAERSSDAPVIVARATIALISDPSITAKQAAELLEGAERADNTRYAKEARRILEHELAAGLSIHHLAFLAYPVRNQGLTFTDVPGLKRVEAIASKLPGRKDAPWEITARTVASGLTESVLDRLFAIATPSDTVRLLEALSGLVLISEETIRSMMSRLPAPADVESGDLWARTIKACSEHIHRSSWDDFFGTIDFRANMISQCDPYALSVMIDSPSKSVTQTRILPIEPLDRAIPAWDVPLKNRSQDTANDEAVAAAQRLADACPELDRFEVVTVTASGRRFRIFGSEPGYKNMARDAFKDRVEVRRSVGFQAALKRSTAAESWTGMIEDQIAIADRLTLLTELGIFRLAANDNYGRRHQWIRDVEELGRQTSALASHPNSPGFDPAASHARADDTDRATDPTSQALDTLAKALPALTKNGKTLPIAMTLRDAASRLVAAKSQSNPVLAHLGEPIPRKLLIAISRLAGALAGIDRDTSARQRIRGTDSELATLAVVEPIAQALRGRQEEILSSALAVVGNAQLHRLIDPDPASWSLDDTMWLIAAPVEQWDELIQALRAIDDDMRKELGCRVVAIALDTSSDTASFGSQVALPIAIQLGIGTEHSEHVLSTENIVPLLHQAGIAIRTGGGAARAITDVVNELIMISWERSRRQLRDSNWLEQELVDKQNKNGPYPESLRNQVVDATALLGEDTMVVARNALEVLIGHVVQECAGGAEVSLAGVVFERHSHVAASAPSSIRLLNAMGELSLAGLFEA